MNFHIITLFPDSLSSYINESIIGRAQKEGHIKIAFYNPRDFVKIPKAKLAEIKKKQAQALMQGKVGMKFTEPYKRIDDKPYGGGPGMVMQAEPLIKAIEKALTIARKNAKSKSKKSKSGTGGMRKIGTNKGARIKIIFLTPAGEQFTNEYARKTAGKYSDVIIICGRYEGMDARVRDIFKAEEVSVGPYVLTGGELGAMIIIDAMSRQIKGVLGDFNSLEESRAASSEIYTRPEVLVYKGKKYHVPKILLSGDRAKIDEWKMKKKEGDNADGKDA